MREQRRRYCLTTYVDNLGETGFSAQYNLDGVEALLAANTNKGLCIIATLIKVCALLLLFSSLRMAIAHIGKLRDRPTKPSPVQDKRGALIVTILALKTNSVHMLRLDRTDGLTVSINLANAKRISFDVEQAIVSIAYVDGGYETFTDFDAMNLASQIRQIHAQQNLIVEDFE